MIEHPIMSDEKIKRWAEQNIYSNDPNILTDLRCMARECVSQAARIKELEEVLHRVTEKFKSALFEVIPGDREILAEVKEALQKGE